MAGRARQTSVEMPVTMSFLRPAALTASTTRLSSQVLTVVRSMIGTARRTSASSGTIGPHIFRRGHRNGHSEREHCTCQTNDVVLELKGVNVTDAGVQTNLVIQQEEQQ